jgi:hypothetical protein
VPAGHGGWRRGAGSGGGDSAGGGAAMSRTEATCLITVTLLFGSAAFVVALYGDGFLAALFALISGIPFISYLVIHHG